MIRALALTLACLTLPLAAATPAPLVVADFEQDLAGWAPFWSRGQENGKPAGSATLDAQTLHGGRSAVRLEHRTDHDWSFARAQRLPVQEGELLELSAWVKLQGPVVVTPSVIAYDAKGTAVDWALGGRAVRAAANWQLVRSRILIPPGVTGITPRIMGERAGVAWVDDFTLTRVGHLKDLRDPHLPATLTLRNAALTVTLDTAKATWSVTDIRTGQTWAQRPVGGDLLVTKAAAKDSALDLSLLVTDGLDLRVTLALDGDKPELLVGLAGEGELRKPLAFPHPFTSDAGTYLVVPMNEGISYPVDDPEIPTRRLIAYGGHGICMPFFGVTDGARGQMAILETPDDAAIRIARVAGKLAIAPEWDPEKGKFGYERRLRYVFFEKGGHVAMAKRYRAHAQQAGLLKTLDAKRRENPNVDLLVGAVNVWCWDKDGPTIARELQAAGIQRILWSNAQSPANLKALNEMPGVLTSRYDIYQDLMDPAQFPRLRYIHRDWTTAGWPKDIMLGPTGDWIKGWQIELKDGSGMVPCGVLCDRQAPAYARQRIPAELQTHPYRSRFIDTTTAAPWRECYDPDHPVTRRESRRYKMELLRVVSEENKLVCGSETGHDAAAPFVHYFEGMLSLGDYRVPDSGRKMQQILDQVPERVAKFQVGQKYRLPLWELVYHDCVVAQWYWGDYNNKLPAIWAKRNLFNALYGTPPMFMFNRELWAKNKDRFVQSYHATCAIARATGYSEMTDHRFLTPDRDVQQTRFAGGVTVTVNFGDRPHPLADGQEVKPMGMVVEGLK